MGINANFFHYHSLDDPLWDHLTIREAAQLAEASYETSDENKIPERWRQVGESRFLASGDDPRDSAFFGRIFVHNEREEALIGFAGLQKVSDLLLCGQYLVGKSLPLWEKLAAFVDEIGRPLIGNRRIHVLGHSLGGPVAQLVGYHYDWPSLSIDGPGVKSLIRGEIDPEKEAKTHTLMLMPNLINQMGQSLGTQIYLCPDDRGDYELDIDEMAERCALASQIRAQPEDEKEWFQGEDFVDFALFLVQKTIAFHAISNFTEARPDVESAKIYVEVLKQLIPGKSWQEAHEKFIQGWLEGIDHFSNGIKTLVSKSANGCFYGSRIGNAGGQLIGKGIGIPLGAAVGACSEATDSGVTWGLYGLVGGMAVAGLAVAFAPGALVIFPASSWISGSLGTTIATGIASAKISGGIGAAKGVVTGLINGARLGNLLGGAVGSGLGTTAGGALGTGIGAASSIEKTLECLIEGTTVIVAESAGEIFFHLLVLLQPQMSQAFQERLEVIRREIP